jgi:hypothetical protein
MRQFDDIFMTNVIFNCTQSRFSNQHPISSICVCLIASLSIFFGKYMPQPDSAGPVAASVQIDKRIDELNDWRGIMLSQLRQLIKEADPDVLEEVKWKKPSNSMRGVPVWSHDGIICTGETYKDKVKLTFATGAALPDPAKIFNASLDGGTRRAIDIFEGQAINAAAFKTLIRAAVTFNTAKALSKSKRTKPSC